MTAEMDPEDMGPPEGVKPGTPAHREWMIAVWDKYHPPEPEPEPRPMSEKERARLAALNRATPRASQAAGTPYYDANTGRMVYPGDEPEPEATPTDAATLRQLADEESATSVARDGTRASPLWSRDDDGPATLPPPHEPMRVAAVLVGDRFSGQDGSLRLLHWRGAFWLWQGPHWSELGDDDLKTAAYRFAESAVWDKDGHPQPWAPNRHKVGDLIEALQATVHTSPSVTMPSWHATVPEWSLDIRALVSDTFVSCSNGILHVPTRTLIDHDPAYFNAVSVPFPFEAKAPRPKGWLRFLGQLWPDDPDAVNALGEFFGYVVSGRTDLHKILLLIGPTRAGKGVIARVLRALVGHGNSAGPTLSSLGQNFGLQPLIGKALAIISDARLGGSETNMVVERLLSISGEDMLTIDRKYKDPWTGTLTTRFLVISNELPRFGDASGAIANRFVVLTLKRSWLGHEDPTLTSKLLTELPGILGWALDGLDRLTARGFMSEPRSSEEAKSALADLVSPTSAFVRDRCDVGPSEEVAVEALFEAWRDWAESNGHRASTAQVFGRNLRAVLPGLRTYQPREGGGRERWYQGVSLLSPSRSHGGSARVPSRAVRVGGPFPGDAAGDEAPPDAETPTGFPVEDDYPASAYEADTEGDTP